MDKELQEKLETACWIAHTLFARGKAAGSSANMSFRHNGHIFITSSGTCFGSLTPEHFTETDMKGTVLAGRKPSKEFPLHQALFEKGEEIGAVVHTHSLYSTLWSCLPQVDETDIVPEYTPYLRMKVGTIGLVPYARPGSQELFALFRQRAAKSDGFLLAHHGPIVPGKTLLDAFYGLEELEESAAIAWQLQDKKIPQLR